MEKEEMGQFIGGELIRQETGSGSHVTRIPGVGTISRDYSKDCHTINTDTGRIADGRRYYEGDEKIEDPCDYISYPQDVDFDSNH